MLTLCRATKTTEIPTMECLAYGKVNLAYLGADEMAETDIYDLPRDWLYIKRYFIWYTHIEYRLGIVALCCTSADMLFVMNTQQLH